MNMVKVAKLGSTVVEVALEDGAKVSQALTAAKVAADGFEVRLNGAPVSADVVVRSGDIVTLIPAIKGGINLVKVAKLGETVREVVLEDDTTIAKALTVAGVGADGFEVRLNGAPVSTDAVVRSGDIITLIPAIKGGC